MVKKIFGRLSKPQKEAISVFVLAIVEILDNLRVKKLVKEPTSPPPFASITKDGNAPRVHVHAWRSG